MNIRDYDFIEDRLLAPELRATEAVGRLRQHGHDDLADRVMDATKAFTDECRAVRYALAERDTRG